MERLGEEVDRVDDRIFDKVSFGIHLGVFCMVSQYSGESHAIGSKIPNPLIYSNSQLSPLIIAFSSPTVIREILEVKRHCGKKFGYTLGSTSLGAGINA